MLTKRNYNKLCKVLDNAAYIYYNKEDKSIIPDADFDKAEKMCDEYEAAYPDKVSPYSRSLNIGAKGVYDENKLDYVYDFYKITGNVSMSKSDYIDYLKNNI